MSETQTPFILLNGLQIDALHRLGDSSDISVLALRREDSLGNVLDHNNGVLVAHFQLHSGERLSYAISELGQTSAWPTAYGEMPV